MNTQSPMTLDERLWAAEAQLKSLKAENAELRDLIETLRGLASSRKAREATAREVTAEAAEYACNRSFGNVDQAP